MLRKLSSGQGCPSKKCIFGHVTSLIGENVIAANSENFPGLLHTPAKYEKNPPYGYETIAKYKQASLAGRLIGTNRKQRNSRQNMAVLIINTVCIDLVFQHKCCYNHHITFTKCIW